jgi:pimeloyl-ACP methyl ester carboxylesterase
MECFDKAQRLEYLRRDEALRLYVESMGSAYEALLQSGAEASSSPLDPQQSAAYLAYNRSLERFLRLAGGHKFRPDDSWRGELAERGVPIEIRRDASVWSPERFDELRFAGDFVVRGMHHYHGSDGVGVPLIAIRRPTAQELDGRQGADRFYPYWEVYPVTACLRFERSGAAAGPPTLELHDTLRFTEFAIDGHSLPLAADLTTPTAYHIARGRLSKYERVSLFRPQRLAREAGLHMLHPYERGKIPVIMIHGLGSSPKEWGRVLDELRGDPALREQYQFWMYMYPTGESFMFSAAGFRSSLAEARLAVDPEGTDRAFDRMVLIGHSMGGLIAKLAITDSGDELWRLISNQPFDRLVAQPADRDVVARIFFFKPLPFVERVVFIATPHRGSKLGNQLIGRLGDRLIRLPGPLEEAHERLVTANGADFFTPLFPERLPSSIDVLGLENPILLAIDRLPVAAGVTAHTIVGKVRNGPLETSTDSVVPYASSHLDWASSECVVPTNHFCQDNPQTIEELRRILRLHQEEPPPSSRMASRRRAGPSS